MPEPTSPASTGGWLYLGSGPDAVRDGRRWAHRQAQGAGAGVLADDVALVAAELLANAVQHGTPPTAVAVSAGPDLVKVAVRDANPRPPVVVMPGNTNMTGRGLALVAALAERWGVQPHPEGGKVVWAELVHPATAGHDPVTSAGADQLPQRPAAPASAAASGDSAEADSLGRDGEVDIDALLAAWPDEDADTASDTRHAVATTDTPVHEVQLGEVPTALLVEAKAHVDNLVRELTLMSADPATELPAPLAALVDAVLHDFADARDAIKRQALAAAHRGDEGTDLVLHLPVTAADAGERYLAALDDADRYAHQAQLLTLETPPVHRAFRRWYVTSLVTQLRAAAAGQRAPVIPFRP